MKKKKQIHPLAQFLQEGKKQQQNKPRQRKQKSQPNPFTQFMKDMQKGPQPHHNKKKPLIKSTPVRIKPFINLGEQKKQQPTQRKPLLQVTPPRIESIFQMDTRQRKRPSTWQKQRLTFPQAFRQFRLPPVGDRDKDGVMNLFDCRPYNPRMHMADDQRKAMFAKLKKEGKYDPIKDKSLRGGPYDPRTWKDDIVISPMGPVKRYDMLDDQMSKYCEIKGIPKPEEGTDEYYHLMLLLGQVSTWRARNPELLQQKIRERAKERNISIEQANDEVSNMLVKDIEQYMGHGHLIDNITTTTMTESQFDGIAERAKQIDHQKFLDYIKKFPEKNERILIEIDEGDLHKTTMLEAEQKVREVGGKYITGIIFLDNPEASMDFLEGLTAVGSGSPPKKKRSQPVSKKEIKKILEEQKEKRRKQRREQKIAEELRRQQKIAERRKRKKEKDTGPSFDYKPPESVKNTESPAARAKRIAREQKAKKESKKFKKKSRFSYDDYDEGDHLFSSGLFNW